jgi:hypothetical protein
MALGAATLPARWEKYGYDHPYLADCSHYYRW